VGPFGVAVGVTAGVGVDAAVITGDSVGTGVAVAVGAGVAVGSGVFVAVSVGASVASGMAGVAQAPSRINVKHIAIILRNVRRCFIKAPCLSFYLFLETKKEPQLL